MNPSSFAMTVLPSPGGGAIFNHGSQNQGATLVVKKHKIIYDNLHIYLIKFGGERNNWGPMWSRSEFLCRLKAMAQF